MIKNHEYAFSFLLIILVVTIANLHNVFGLDVLLQDDNSRYHAFLNDNLWLELPKRILRLNALIKWPFVYIFSNYSIELARLLMLMAFMLPLSCLNYVFNRKYLGLPVWVSLGSAIIINIIPKQYLIPAFLDGSYPVVGALAFFLTLIFASVYLQSPRPSILVLAAVAFCWMAMSDFINEMIFFLFPATLYYIHSSAGRPNIKSRLYGVLSLCTLFWLAHYFWMFGHIQNRIPVKLSVQEIASRISLSFDWWLPFTSSLATRIPAAVLVLLLLGYGYARSLTATNKNARNSGAYIFYGICVFCALPFWIASPYTTSRHFYLSYMALTTLTLMALYQVFVLPRRHKRIIAILSLAGILSLYTVQRYLLNRAFFNELNQSNTMMLSLLREKSIDADTQITFVNVKNLTYGLPLWGAGHLQYQLKMPGIRGIIGEEMNFYDPFDLEGCPWERRMSCLDYTKKLIAFKRENNGYFTEMKYFLRWFNPGERDSEWVIFGTNSKHEISKIDSASGFPAYQSTLSRLGISPRQVLWGDYENEKMEKSLFQ